MRKVFILVLLSISFGVSAQKNGVTFEVETLKKPTTLLRLTPYNDVFKDMILTDLSIGKWKFNLIDNDIPYNIVAQSNGCDSLVAYDYHSFFNGMYQAYSDHRPFVLSPDMVWLLISQGFAQHVNNNSEELRKYFVNFDGKLSLIVRNDKIKLNDPKSPWEDVFPEFTKQIGTFTGPDLVNTLTCNFTTTTPVTKVASQITIMEAMKSYFEFIVIYAGCGIPQITLEGTPQDWQKVLDKTNYLRKYKLDWWVDELNPILKEFVKASNGKVNKCFWQTMFKYHSQKKYGAPNIVDGWIVKFYPYDKDGKRNNLKEIIGTDKLPKEIVKVDLQYIYIKENGETEKTPLELWAGFTGLQQNQATFALKPEIGWMIRKTDINNAALINKFKSDNNSEFGSGIDIRVKVIPPELLSLEEINNLNITFIDSIQIPDAMNKIKISRFSMSGKITDSEIERICKLLPNTKLFINREKYNVQRK